MNQPNAKAKVFVKSRALVSLRVSHRAQQQFWDKYTYINYN